MIRRFIVHIKSSIKHQLFISYAFLGIFLLFLFFILATTNLSRDLKQDKYNEVNAVNGQTKILLDKYIQDLNRFTLNYYYADHMTKLLTTVNKQKGFEDMDYINSMYTIKLSFGGAMEAYKEFDGIYLFALNGEPVYDLQRGKGGRISNAAGEEWFEEALQMHGIYRLKGRSSSYSQRTEVITVNRAFIDISTLKNIGVISIQINAESLGRALGLDTLSEIGMVMILDEEGGLVFSHHMELAAGLLSVLAPVWHEEEPEQDFWINYEGEDYYVIHTASDSGWRVVTCVEKSDILSKTRSLQRTLILLVMICVVLTFVFSYLYAGRASASLVRMTRYMKRFEEGELDLNIQVRGDNEIARLERGFNSMSGRIRELIEKEYAQNLLRQEAELHYLQNQINPHFLANTLGMIRYEAEQEHAENTREMIGQLSMIFRYNMGKEGNIVCLKEEIAHIRNYLAIQQARFKDKLQVSFALDERIMHILAPRMILQPLVENAIVHGIERSCEPCMIRLAAEIADNCCQISICNTGVGMDRQQVEAMNEMLDVDVHAFSCIEDFNMQKMGVHNVNARIRYMYSRNYGLHFDYVEGGTCVRIRLPLNTQTDAGEEDGHV